MTTKLFLDTNVLIDYYARRAPYFDQCISLRVMQAFGDAELWVSAKSFTDVFYVLKRSVGASELQRAFAQSVAAETGFLRVCSITGADIEAAAAAAWPDFEDCLVHQAALKVQASAILTRDAAGFAQATVPVYTPVEFFKRLHAKRGVEYSVEGLV